MYQSIGITGLLKAFGLFATLIFVVLLFLGTEWALLELLRKASLSVTITALMTYIVGETPLFPRLCKFPIVRSYFPPIDGVWEVTVESNWGKIKQMMSIENCYSPSNITGLITIKARLLTVNISFQSDSRYSSSRSVCVGIDRDKRDSVIKLNYIYENQTQVPDITDSPTHNGAARLTIYDEKKGLTMRGTYWTDRKWTEGMNTAGTITFCRAGDA